MPTACLACLVHITAVQVGLRSRPSSRSRQIFDDLCPVPTCSKSAAWLSSPKNCHQVRKHEQLHDALSFDAAATAADAVLLLFQEAGKLGWAVVENDDFLFKSQNVVIKNMTFIAA